MPCQTHLVVVGRAVLFSSLPHRHTRVMRVAQHTACAPHTCAQLPPSCSQPPARAMPEKPAPHSCHRRLRHTHLHAQDRQLSTQHADLLARLRQLHACAPEFAALHGHIASPRQQLALASHLLPVHHTQRTRGVLPADRHTRPNSTPQRARHNRQHPDKQTILSAPAEACCVGSNSGW